MKYINLILSLAGVSLASICGDIILNSQEDVDAKANCAVAFGDVKLGPELTDYVRLEKLGVINGNLIGTDLNSLSLISLPALLGVEGNVELTGAISEVSLPSLKSVKGDFTIVTSEILQCSNFDKLAESGINGQFECQAASV